VAGLINTGFAHEIRPNAEVDLGGNSVVTDGAADDQSSAGSSFRF
jgi:hypothetical protein